MRSLQREVDIRSAVTCIGMVNSNFFWLLFFLIRVNAGVQLFITDPEMRIRKSLSA